MYLTGFADEAAKDLATQIRATLELGWSAIESRNIDGVSIHDLDDAAFDRAVAQLEESGVRINCFGSAIANWGKRIDSEEDFQKDLAQVGRAIPRMRRLGTKLVRIMSYAVLPDRGPEDQMEQERFRRLREITKRFLDAGIQPVHENCMNYGGMGWPYTLRLLENVPGLKLVFDTGNPIFTLDRSKPEPYPYESSWEFYENVRDFVEYVHIKDGVRDSEGAHEFTWCGEGLGDVKRICADLFARGYDGGFSMEPHLAVVFHDASVQSPDDVRYANYVEYGRRFEAILRDVGYEW
ncbi:MAG: sugar phosphate isomerase/epimerase family protein [Kiritimatiellia bacterium]|jgi:sugar phosphate isomerase/epimerase